MTASLLTYAPAFAEGQCAPHLRVYPVRGRHQNGFIPTAGNPSTWRCDGKTSKSDFARGRHLGNDIWAAEGTPVVATVPGTLKFVGFDRYSGNHVTVVDDCGWYHFSTHLKSIAPGMRDGKRVGPGTVIGTVGKSGTASNGVVHLHYSIYPRNNYDAGIDPHPHLRAVEKNTCTASGSGASADVTGDGHGDLVMHTTSKTGAGELWVWQGKANGFWDKPLVPFQNSAAMARVKLAVADVTGDGTSDVILLRKVKDGADIHLLRGGTTVRGLGARIRSFGRRFEDLEVAGGDVTGDGHGDLVVHGRAPGGAGELWVFQGNANGFWQKPMIPFQNSAAMARVKLAVTDVTGDGTEDIALLRSVKTGTDVHLLRGGKTLRGLGTRIRALDRPLDELSAAGGDATGDGHGDLVVRASSPARGGELWIFQGNDKGFWQKPLVPFQKSAAMAEAMLAVTDVTGDGAEDVVLVRPAATGAEIHLLRGGKNPTGVGARIRAFGRRFDLISLAEGSGPVRPAEARADSAKQIDPAMRPGHAGLARPSVFPAVTDPKARRARATIIRDAARSRGMKNGALLAGIASAEGGMAHCWSESTWACKGPASPSCGGGPVLAGRFDGACSARQGGLGMYQFDSGTYEQTLRQHGRDILLLEGNVRHVIDFLTGRIIESVPGVHDAAQAIAWMNAVPVRAGHPRFKVWVSFVACRYNGRCHGSEHAQWSKMYENATLGVVREFGEAYWNRGGGLLATDVTGDGHGDLVIHTTSKGGAGELWVWQGNRTGFWQKPLMPFQNSAAMANVKLAVTDVTGDGLTDVILVREVKGGADIHLLRGGKKPTGMGARIRTFGRRFDDLEVAGGDVTGDGHGDLVIHSRAGNGAGELWIFQGNANGFWQKPIVPFQNSAAMARVKLAVTDVNGDGAEDIALLRSTKAGADVHLLRGGKAPRGLGTRIRAFGRAFDQLRLAAGDVTADGHGDLVIHSRGPRGAGELWIMQGNATGFWQKPLVPFQDSAAMAEAKLAVTDVTGDGAEDILLVRPSKGGVDIHLLRGGKNPTGVGARVTAFGRGFPVIRLAEGSARTTSAG